MVEGSWKNPNAATWIPDDASEVQIQLCTTAHTVPTGHRGQIATEQILSQSYAWKTFTPDTRFFVVIESIVFQL